MIEHRQPYCPINVVVVLLIGLSIGRCDSEESPDLQLTMVEPVQNDTLFIGEPFRILAEVQASVHIESIDIGLWQGPGRRGEPFFYFEREYGKDIMSAQIDTTLTLPVVQTSDLVGIYTISAGVVIKGRNGFFGTLVYLKQW
jgi:hypothetical protein